MTLVCGCGRRGLPLVAAACKVHLHEGQQASESGTELLQDWHSSGLGACQRGSSMAEVLSSCEHKASHSTAPSAWSESSLAQHAHTRTLDFPSALPTTSGKALHQLPLAVMAEGLASLACAVCRRHHHLVTCCWVPWMAIASAWVMRRASDVSLPSLLVATWPLRP